MERKRMSLLAAVTFLSILSMLVGCQRDTADVLILTTENYGGSKDYMGSNHMVCWSGGDQVRINDGVYSVAVDVNSNKATIAASGVTSFGGNYYAVYPAEGSSVGIDGTVIFSLSAEETYQTDGVRQVLNNAMAAHSSGSTLAMKNLCSMLRFPVSGTTGMKLCAIEVSSSKTLWGEMTATPDGDGWTVAVPATDGNTTRRLVFSTPLELSSTAQYVYMLVPPASDAENFTLRYYLEDNNGNVTAYQRSKSTSVSFTAGMIYGFDAVAFNGAAPSGYSQVTLGGQDAPYRVFSSEGWTALNSALSSTSKKYFVLENDVTVTSPITSLYSSIDGNGHTITLSGTSSLTKRLESNAVVKNLTVDAPTTVTSVTAESNAFGFIACYAVASSEINNCVNKCDLDCASGSAVNHVGAICGDARGVVKNCRNEGNISAKSEALGGLVGYFGGTALSGCVNQGDLHIVQNTGYVICGGVAGEVSANGATVSDCVNSASVIGESDGTTANYIGGVFGRALSSLSKCHNTGLVRCVNANNKAVYVGGVVGAHNYTAATAKSMTDCWNEGDIVFSSSQTKNYAGGLVGLMKRLNIINCYAYCDIGYASKAGGLVAECDPFEALALTNCYFYGSMTNTIGNYRFLANKVSSTYGVTANYCYSHSALTTYSGCTENNCGVLSDALTIGGNASLVNALNAQRGAYSVWVERNDHAMFE